VSHFAVVVRLPGSLSEPEVGDAVDAALAPYQENNMGDCPKQYLKFNDVTDEYTKEYAESEEHRREYPTLDDFISKYAGYKKDETTGRFGDWENPNRKWDWWAIGGRWSGFFPIKSAATTKTAREIALDAAIAEAQAGLRGATTPDARWPFIELERRLRAELYQEVAAAQPGVRLGRPGTFGNAPERGHGDIVRKREIDWDLVATQTREAIEKFHGEWERFVAGEKFSAIEGPTDKAMRIGLLETRQGPPLPGEEGRAIPWSTLVRPGDTRAHWHYIWTRVSLDDLIAKYADAFAPISGYAYLDETGWHEPGRMGWFGCSSDTPETLLESKRSFTQWLKETPDDAWLVAVDCHI
jgi:hypothetical protein